MEDEKVHGHHFITSTIHSDLRERCQRSFMLREGREAERNSNFIKRIWLEKRLPKWRWWRRNNRIIIPDMAPPTIFSKISNFCWKSSNSAG